MDGDTLVLLMDGSQVKVRLIGVDTAETVHPSKPVEAYGKEASHFLTNLLTGESVYLEYEQGSPSLDKYGLTLAYLYRVPDGLFVNLEIVRQGYGHAYTVFPFKYMELFRFYETKAREAGKGLWNPDLTAESETNSNIQVNTQTPAKANEASDQTMVYITKTGAKYHREGCRSLAKSKIPISVKDAKARGYAPCSICNPPK